MRPLYLLVSCALEESRAAVLEKCVNSFTSQWTYGQEWRENFVVFDNASTVPSAQRSLEKLRCEVVRAKENYGYWSAVNWAINHFQDRDVVYIIESDSVHYGIEKLSVAIEFLRENADVGMVRTQEFSVVSRHLYDKRNPHRDSRTTEWCVQHNVFTNSPVTFEATGYDRVYRTNMVAKMCGLHRTATLSSVLSTHAGPFNEVDFQRKYHELHPVNGLIDDGIFHTRPSYETGVKGGSYIEGPAGIKDEWGYTKTRDGIIFPVESMVVRT